MSIQPTWETTQQTSQEMWRKEYEQERKQSTKWEVKEYKTFQGVIQVTKDIILEAVGNEYLMEIEDKILGYLNQMPTDMLTHLRTLGGALDFVDTKEEIRLPPIQLEVYEEHLKLHGAHRIKVVATRERDIE